MRRRQVAEDDDLQALDPLTGNAILTGDRAALKTYGRRLRRMRMAFIVLSFTAASLAAFTGWSIATLRRVERTWRTAMAVDLVRHETDGAIFDELERFDPDADTTDSFLLGVGVAATSELANAETALTQQTIRDRRTAALRDLMVEALEFRQRQMSPQRRQLGNTPLIRAEEVLSAELRRWRLEPSHVPEPRLVAADDAIDLLRQFVDESTSTTTVTIESQR